MFVWRDFAQRRQLDVTFDFKRYVARAVGGLKNVAIVDLQPHAEITTDLDLYMDIYHFAPQVNRWMIERTCAGLDRVDAAGATDAEQRLRAELARWRPPATTDTR
jgi:protein-arginine kinase